MGVRVGMRKTSCRNGLRKVDPYGRRKRSCFTNSLQPESGWFNLLQQRSRTQQGQESPSLIQLLPSPDSYREKPLENAMG